MDNFLKRLTETNKWRDPWYRKLSSPAKQLWEYLRDNCDSIGLIELDLALASADCGQLIEEKNVSELGNRVQWLGSNRYFLPKFIHFQYGELTPTCPPHRPVIKLAQSHKLLRIGIHYAYPNATLTQITEVSVTSTNQPYPNARVSLPLRQDKTRQEWKGQDPTEKLMNLVGSLYDRPKEARWSFSDQSALSEIARRDNPLEEFEALVNYRDKLPKKDKKFFPQSVNRLLQNWDEVLDRARGFKEQSCF